MSNKPITPSDAGRLMQSLRKKHGAGSGRPRTIEHDPNHYCRCIDCRKARGTYPNKTAKKTT